VSAAGAGCDFSRYLVCWSFFRGCGAREACAAHRPAAMAPPPRIALSQSGAGLFFCDPLRESSGYACAPGARQARQNAPHSLTATTATTRAHHLAQLICMAGCAVSVFILFFPKDILLLLSGFAAYAVQTDRRAPCIGRGLARVRPCAHDRTCTCVYRVCQRTRPRFVGLGPNLASALL